MAKRFQALLLTMAMLTMFISTAFADEVSRMLPNPDSAGTWHTVSGGGRLFHGVGQYDGPARSAAYGQYAVTEKSGTYEKWIDRVTISDTGRRLYDILVEGSDGDGDRDYLIDDQYYNLSGPTTDVTNVQIGSQFLMDDNGDRMSCILLDVIESTQAEVNSSKTSLNRLNYEINSIIAAAIAFDRDHPEVFWVNDAYNYYILCYGVQGSPNCTVYLMYGICSSEDGSISGRRSVFRSAAEVKAAISSMDANVESILAGVPSNASNYEKVAYFNQWLVQHNEYSTQPDLYDDNACPWDIREPSNALEGKRGLEGPVCESYARALKVLCDRVNIPCVLVGGYGTSYPGGASERHMWNYVQLDGIWYAVDVTWDGADYYRGDGYENWLLVGADKVQSGLRFADSHRCTNADPNADLNYAITFTNGPQLSSADYDPSQSPGQTFRLSYQNIPETLTVGTPIQTIQPVLYSGGTGAAYTYSADGQLPPGLSMYSDGTISGTPILASEESVSLKVTVSSIYGSATYTIVFPPVRSAARQKNTVTFSSPTTTFYKTGSENPGVSFTATATSLGEITYEYKARGADDSTYTTAVPTEVGQYTVRASVGASDTYEAASATLDFEIVDQAAFQPETGGTTETARPGNKVVSVPGMVVGTTEGAAVIAVDEAVAAEMVRQAKADNAGLVEIHAEVPSGVAMAMITLPEDRVRTLAAETAAGIRLNLNIATVTLPGRSLRELMAYTGDLSLIVYHSGADAFVAVGMGETPIEEISGGLTLQFSYPGCTYGTVAMQMREDNSTETIGTSLADPETGIVSIPLEGLAVVSLADNSLTFSDVAAKDWFSDSVAFASSHQLMVGVDASHFNPLDKITRGSFITILYHLAKNPAMGDPVYADTAKGAWYTDAVTWSALNQIATGVGPDTFDPAGVITRETMVLMMYNFAAYRGADVSARADLSDFADAGSISDEALAAMQWAVAEDLVHGVGGNRLAPGDSASRSEVAALLMHYCEVLAR